MRRPPERASVVRTQDQASRLLREPVPDRAYLQDLASRATFKGWEKHKLWPRKFGMVPYSGKKVESTYCDGDAQFDPSHIADVPKWLALGIEAGLVGEEERARNEPALIWTVAYEGWIFEGRITVPGQAIYHAYPVLANDPTGDVVLRRYRYWVQENLTEDLLISLAACEDRYT